MVGFKNTLVLLPAEQAPDVQQGSQITIYCWGILGPYRRLFASIKGEVLARLFWDQSVLVLMVAQDEMNGLRLRARLRPQLHFFSRASLEQ